VRDHAEALTNWYVRRSRDRFWDGDVDAIDTLHTVLEVTARVAAPLLPLTMERLWQGLTGGRSVHLTDWPTSAELPHDDALVVAMDRVRQVASSALSLRKARGLRVRLPLATLTVAAADAETLAPFADILRDEVNVKNVALTTDVAAHGRFEIAVNARACGPRLGGDTQKVIRAVKSGEWTANADGTVTAAGIELREGEFTEKLVAADPEETTALPGNTGLVVLDTAVTPELAAEGTAKDVVRLVQQARRDAGLDVSDRITLTLDGPDAVLAAVRTHEPFLAGEVLATAVTNAQVPEPTSTGTVTGPDGSPAETRAQVTRTP
jgi:isoleucyl-tRNA synthetase